MFGLDEAIAHLSSGASVLVVILLAAVLGLRHATDPDHIAAVTTLVASGEKKAGRAAARLGAFWGLGHALTLVLFGLPILLFQQFLPERVQQGAETAVAALIVFLALRLLVRWRHGFFDLHAHVHDSEHHRHRVRSPLGAFAIGLVHGTGGSAGVGVLILAAIPSSAVACVALVVLAAFTAVSMTIVTTGLGLTLSSNRVASAFNGVAPLLGVMSLSFGIWYAVAAWGVVAYPL
jgi:hypothetical protein